MAKWFLIDGHNLAFRSFYAIPELSRSDGFPTNAIHGWLRTLWKLEDEWRPDHMVVFFDLGKSDFREGLNKEYKSQRGETPDALRLQLPVIRELTVAMGYACIERRGIEADDLIGHTALNLIRHDNEIYIVSADKDLAQLLRKGISQLLPPPTANPKIGWRLLDTDGVKEKFGVTPEQIPDYLALVGDTSDNISGLPGVGPKTASKWLNQYRNLETIIANCGRLKPPRFQQIVYDYADYLRTNLQITTLETLQEDVALTFPDNDIEKLQTLLNDLEMTKSRAEAAQRYAQNGSFV